MQVLWEGGGNAWDLGPIQSTTPAAMANQPVRTESADGSQSVVFTNSYDKSTITHTVTLRPGIPRVDFNLDMDWQEQFQPGKGGAFLKTAFDTSMQNSEAWWEIPFGAIHRTYTGEAPGLRWMDVDETTTTTAPAQATPVSLASVFNGDAFSTQANPHKGAFDQDANSLDVATIPTAGRVSIAGLPYLAPDPNSHSNEVVAKGQVISMPANNGGDLYFLASSSNGDATGVLGVQFAGRASISIPITIVDWCVGQGEPTAFSHQGWVSPTGAAGSNITHIWVVRAPITGDRPITSVTLPTDPQIHIFALTIGPHITETPTFGVAVLNNGRYGSDINDGTMRLSLVRSAGDPDKIFDVGQHSLRYALYAPGLELEHPAGLRAHQRT
jgi:hypothetical protein